MAKLITKNGKVVVQNGTVIVKPIPLCFTAQQANSTVELIKVGTPSIANTAYSLDGKTWTTFEPSTTAGTNTITLTNVGDKVYFRNNITANFSYSSYLQFKVSGLVAASGNCNSIYSSNSFEELTALVYSQCYYNLFYDCITLTTAPALPATTLSSNCYQQMFYNCTSLTTVPSELPATILTPNCYRNMFYGCSSLLIAPVISATTLADYCCQGMFRGCTSLTTAPVLSVTTLASYCYYVMFMNCTSLTAAPILPATTLESSCYNGMFANCTSLTTVPKLQATAFSGSCYQSMFSGCTSLIISDTSGIGYTNAWRLPANGVFTDTYTNRSMFQYCAGTRSSDDLSGIAGQYKTYYTQNQPV